MDKHKILKKARVSKKDERKWKMKLKVINSAGLV